MDVGKLIEYLESWAKTWDEPSDHYKDGMRAAAALRELQGEVNEQARLLGMGSEREAKLMAERDALKAEVLQALSFGFSTACVLLDKGVDPRHYELPRLLDEWKAEREE